MTGTIAPITACRACASDRLETVLSLGPLPPSDAFIAADALDKDEARYPLDVAFCHDCALVQILHTVPPEELFAADYPYFSSVIDALVRHAADNVAARIRERQLGPANLVVELASNDGYLLQHYLAAGIDVLGIEPTPGPAAAARDKGIDTRQEFFGRELAAKLVAEGRRADVIHANNVLAHVADTKGFVEGIRALLKDDGVAVIEAHYVRDLIDHGQFDTIYHEHLCYFSVTAVDRLFRQHGLFLNRVERVDIHGGSLRLFVERRDRREASVATLLEEERELGIDRFPYYADFARRVRLIRERLQRLLGDLKAGGARLAGYGAAAKGTILLNYVGIGPETLDFVVDRNRHKQGRWIPGVRLPILAPAALLDAQPDYVLILPWNFKDEIIGQQAEYASRGGRFIIPIPEPMVL
jgi:SAM-dependent methyltransferase